ncbi:MAG: HAMP domain-containing protein [Clostridiales bacterium]|nr:HAMP domain-containing protein [Clostridiales bacterium]
MKIGKKIMLGYGVVIAFMLIIAVVSSVFLGVNYASSQETYEDYGQQQGNMGGWGYYFQQGSALIRNVILFSTDSADMEERIKLVETNNETMAPYEEELDKGIKDENLRPMFENIRANMRTVDGMRDETIELMRQGKVEEATAKLRETTEIVDAISEEIVELFYTMRENAVVHLNMEKTLMIVSISVSVGITVLGGILCVILGLKIGKGISKPVAQVEHAVCQLSEGNLQTRVEEDPNRKDEIGILTRAYNSSVATLGEYIYTIEEAMNSVSRGNLMVEPIQGFKGEFVKIEEAINSFLVAINETFAQINLAAEQVATGSDQGASGAQALSQGATQQASAVEQLDATINEISKHIQENAQNAEFASQEATNLGDGIVNNNQQMQEMIGAMDEISRCSDEISRIIKTIQDIAFQTNILALNAAVEAARAGAAGKGFAVVADEVRNLASKSSEAAKDTTALIENSVKAVKNGIKIANDTAQSLAEIVSKAQEVTDVINKISCASQEQANSVIQVTQGINQISSVVQTNSATAEETAASSEELSGQAQMLKQMMGQYKLRADANGSTVTTNTSYDSPYGSSPYDYSFNDSDLDFNVHDKY